MGIELETRRHNRVNTSVASFENGQLLLDVKQRFGNCLKYIQLCEREAVTYKTLPEKLNFRVLMKASMALYKKTLSLTRIPSLLPVNLTIALKETTLVLMSLIALV